MSKQKNEKAQKQTTRKGRFGRRFVVKWVGVALAVFALAGIVYYATSPQPPAIDLKDVDPEVARLIREQRRRVGLLPRSGEEWGRLGMILQANAFTSTAGPCFVQAERFDPKNATWPYLRAAYTLQDFPDQALPLLQRAVELSSDGPPAPRLRLAELLMDAGRWEEAAPHLRWVLARDKTNARALMGMGRFSDEKEKNIVVGRDYLMQSIRSQPTRAAYVLLAGMLFRQGEKSDAEKVSRDALQFPEQPGWPDPYYDEVMQFEVGLVADLFRGNSLVATGKSDEAIELMQKVTLQHPDSGYAWSTLGDALCQANQLVPAEEAYKRGLEVDKQAAAKLHCGLAHVFFKQEKFTEAADNLREAIRLEPGFGRAWLNLGNCHRARGDWPHAEEAYQNAVRFEPENADVHYNLGEAQFRLGKLTEAATHFRQALQIRPMYVQAHFDLGRVLHLLGKPTEAVECFEQALKIRPNIVETHFYLGSSYGDAGNAEMAVSHYKEALRLKPEYPPAMNNLAWIHATHANSELRDGAEAVRLAEQACRLIGRTQVGVLDSLGAAYAEAGRFKDAVATAEEAVALAKSTKQSKLADEIESRLTLYRANKPFRDSPPAPPSSVKKPLPSM